MKKSSYEILALVIIVAILAAMIYIYWEIISQPINLATLVLLFVFFLVPTLWYAYRQQKKQQAN